MHWIKFPIEFLLLLLISSQLVHAASFIPTDDQQILETLPNDSPPPRYLTSADFVSDTGKITLEETSQLLERAYLQGDPRALGQARAVGSNNRSEYRNPDATGTGASIRSQIL